MTKLQQKKWHDFFAVIPRRTADGTYAYGTCRRRLTQEKNEHGWHDPVFEYKKKGPITFRETA